MDTEIKKDSVVRLADTLKREFSAIDNNSNGLLEKGELDRFAGLYLDKWMRLDERQDPSEALLVAHARTAKANIEALSGLSNDEWFRESGISNKDLDNLKLAYSTQRPESLEPVASLESFLGDAEHIYEELYKQVAECRKQDEELIRNSPAAVDPNGQKPLIPPAPMPNPALDEEKGKRAYKPQAI